MTKYEVIVKFVEHYKHEVTADSQQQAQEQVENGLREGDINVFEGELIENAGDIYVELVTEVNNG